MSVAYTLESLFMAFPGGIIVPRIQRGYVQGRDDEKGREIRANFVPALVDAAFGGKKLTLDFIYGVTPSNGAGMRCLLPLDGQQRLTTLFLLAWLCGKWKADWRFVYETRRIPQLFAQGLVGHAHEATCKPSVEIENSDWFLPIWRENPTVDGMVRMLDALHDAIGERDCTEVDFGRISFLLHGIDGKDETFDHIFRKMNARGKDLSPWENLKAMLDKHLPESLAKAWRDKIDGVWAETIWQHADGDIVTLDNSMEKIARMAYARFAGTEAQDDNLWEMEARLCGNANDEDSKGFPPETLHAFYLATMRYFDDLDSTAIRWTQDRTANALWSGSSDGDDFWTWLSNERDASVADQLRMAFLTESTTQSDATRRLRVLINLLDASSGINGDNFAKALSAGLDFLAGKLDVHGIEKRGAGYSTDQLTDEEHKWNMDEGRIAEFEKDELVHHGSLRFIGWGAFLDEADVKARLEKIRNAIHGDWMAFYRNLGARLSSNKRTITFPVCWGAHDLKYWREEILSDNDFVVAVKAWNASDPPPPEPAWVTHICELANAGKVRKPALRRYGDDDWVYLLNNDSNRSVNSIRLDYNEHERSNRQFLDGGEVVGTGRYKPSIEPGIWFDVVDESWYRSCNPKRFVRNQNGEFVPADRKL